MKRFSTIFASFLFCLMAVAKPPHLNVEKVFDGTYDYNKSVSINISKTKDKYFRGCTVRNDASLVKKIVSLFKADLKRAEKSQDIIENGPKYSSMTIINNNLTINVGLSFEPDNGCYLFITGPNEAFE